MDSREPPIDEHRIAPPDHRGDREMRWVEDYLHRISKAIVQESEYPTKNVQLAMLEVDGEE